MVDLNKSINQNTKLNLDPLENIVVHILPINNVNEELSKLIKEKNLILNQTLNIISGLNAFSILIEKIKQHK